MANGKTRSFGMQRYHIIVVRIDFLEFKISIMLLSGLLPFTCNMARNVYFELIASCEIYS